ncbi:unnamed protein product [Taenia asiatica]|uniref:SGTA_dimer domain-containing protein n=1 Tax=Taenia asiatica TaxID=60517 RepID=A0A0R3WGL0_TAEAS|nr:unnamed protein product [Taenia asiatica]
MDSGREHLIYGLLEELLKVNGGSRTEGEAQHQTLTKAKDVLTACMEQLKSSMSPDLTAGKNPKDGISDAWETSLTELGIAKGKDLDADKPKLQMDALVQNFAKLSIEVLRDAMAKQMLVENFLCEVASIMGEAKNPQTQLQTPTESFDQLNNVKS